MPTRGEDDVWEVALPTGRTEPPGPRRSVSWGGAESSAAMNGGAALPADLADLLVRRASNEADLEAENKLLSAHIQQLQQTLEEVALAELTAELDELELREVELISELSAAREAAADAASREADVEGAAAAARILAAALAIFEPAPAADAGMASVGMDRLSEEAEWLRGYDSPIKEPAEASAAVGEAGRTRALSLDALLGGGSDDDDDETSASGGGGASTAAASTNGRAADGMRTRVDSLGDASVVGSEWDGDEPPLASVGEIEHALSVLRLKMHFMRDKVNQLELANGGSMSGTSGRDSIASNMDDDGYVPFMG